MHPDYIILVVAQVMALLWRAFIQEYKTEIQIKCWLKCEDLMNIDRKSSTIPFCFIFKKRFFSETFYCSGQIVFSIYFRMNNSNFVWWMKTQWNLIKIRIFHLWMFQVLEELLTKLEIEHVTWNSDKKGFYYTIIFPLESGEPTETTLHCCTALGIGLKSGSSVR